MRRRVARVIAASICFCTLLFAEIPAAIWLDVPFVAQSKEGCGAASLAMVMQYWASQPGHNDSPVPEAAQILSELRSPEAHGIYASAMQKYLQQKGYETFAFSGNWNQLDSHLRRGRPLIVALEPIGNGRVLHYVVVAGLDSNSNLVMFNDPAGRKLTKLDRKTFEKEWKVTRNWTLLAVPQSREH